MTPTPPPRPIRPIGLTFALWPVLAGLGACVAAPPARPPAAPPTLTHAAVPAPLPAADPASVPWRDANALVERLKGHAGHLREAPGAAAPAAPAMPAAPAVPAGPDKAVPRRPAASESR